MSRRLVALLGLAVAASACGGEPTVPELRAHAFEIRPTDGTGWNGNGYGSAVTVLHWDTPGGKFRLHYTLEGKHAVAAADADSSGVPDFVESFGKQFDLVYATEVEKLGFRPPLDDSVYHDRPDYGGDGRFDVYLQDQAGSADGYAVVEACKTGTPEQCAAYMVVENDFAYYGYPTPLDGMKVLSSHEFFHAVQDAYRNGLPRGFSEATATWATEQVFPEEKDFEAAIAAFFKQPGRSLGDESSSAVDAFPYGLAIWPAFLAEKHGAKVLPAILDELSEKGTASDPQDAVDRVLARDQKSSLAEAFATFALWNYFTGERAGAGPSYQAAKSYPMVQVSTVDGALPQRVSGEIAFLSSAYYQVTAAKGTQVKVTVERSQPLLAVHLVTGDPKQPTIASIPPEKTSVSLASQGTVTIIAASTARKDSHLPFSLAVTEEAAPAPDSGSPRSDGGPLGDTGTTQPPASSGCALAPAPARAPLTGLALLGLALALPLLYWSRLLPAARSIGRRAARRSRARGALLLALGATLLAALAACSDKAATPDLGADLLRADLSRDLSADHALKPDAPGPLKVGEYVDLPADAAGLVKAAQPLTGSGSERFLALLCSQDETALKQHAYTAKEGSTQPMVLPDPPGGWAGEGSRHRCGFHEQLEKLLASHPKAWREPKTWQAAGQPPKVGDTRTFDIEGLGGVVTVNAKAIAVGANAAFWLDTTTTPLATIDDPTLQQLADGFSKIVVPRDRAYFGKESDINGDGVVDVLLTPTVTDVASRMAYVSLCDLVDPKLVPGCKISNQMELLYMAPPSSLQAPMNTPTALLEVAAHELQHAIYFHHKFVLNNNTSALENPYITEGLSALAEDLSGYGSGTFFTSMATLAGINDVAVPNLSSEDVKTYVPAPADGIMRGAGYLLMRYLFDRAGGETLDAAGLPVDKGGVAWLRAFVEGKPVNVANFTGTTKLTLAELGLQFWTALAVSNRGASGAPITSDPKLNYAPTTTDPLTTKQRGMNLFGTYKGMSLTGPKTQALGAADGKVYAGGGELLTISPAAGAAKLTFTIETEPAAKAIVRLIRIE